MVFSSPRFLVFLAGVLLALGLIGPLGLKKRFLAVASCFFYAAWDWRYLGLLLLVSVVDYVCALRIAGSNSARTRRWWLFASLSSNLGILAWFKYCNFFLDNFNQLLLLFGWHLPEADILLPVGISFYTFKTMSYTIDVYRRELAPCHSWLDYATFITFFPELIAGPIVRGSVFLPQMGRQIGPTPARLGTGATLFAQGLLKKIVVADRLATIADPVFAHPETYAPITIWFGVLAYAIQIYCDFSGYSDMAIGVAQMIGYDLPENFRMPYLSTSITEFWHRWHMTLSAWLRDYLYIPLGGNRRGTVRTYANLILTMLLGGLWHGASWNFVLWGGLHGLALAAHKLWLGLCPGKPPLPRMLGFVLTFLFVLLTWVPFRAKTFALTRIMLGKMLMFGDLRGGLWYPDWLWWLGGAVVLGHMAGVQIQRVAENPLRHQRSERLLEVFGLRVKTLALSGPIAAPFEVRVLGAYLAFLVLLACFYFAPANTNPFIYFQF